MMDRCGYPGCENPAINKWNHPKFGFMCESHDEQESLHAALEYFFEMPVDKLSADIQKRRQQVEQEEIGYSVKDKFGHDKYIPPSGYHMVPVWKKQLRIAEAVYEIRKGE